MKKVLSTVLILSLVMSLFLFSGCTKKQSNAGSTKDGSKKYNIATVVKVSGIAWFDRMEQGVKKFGTDNSNVNAYQVGPEKADAALQVQIIEDLIAKKVDAICVVPFSQEALEPVLKKAREKGIVVISHEASGEQNVDFDIEAFDNKAYGEHFMEKIAQLTGGKGEYAVMVGSLTSKSHNEWVDAAIALQKAKYPDMKLVGDKLESGEDQNVAYQKVKELLKAHPNLVAIQGSSMADPAGAALAVEEMGLSGKVHVVGTSLVSVSGKFLKSGACDMIGFWDPADAGYAMNKLALMMLEGKKDQIKAGLDLGISGYDNLTQNGHVLVGKAWIDATKDNMDKYNF